MLHHYVYPAADGRFLAVYDLPGSRLMHSIGDACTHKGAQALCDAANAKQQAPVATKTVAAHERQQSDTARFYQEA